MKFGLYVIIFFTFIDVAFTATRFLPKSFEAELEQVVHLVTSNSESITPVKMKYMFSNNLYFEVKSEDTPVTYICNKEKTWVYNPPFIEGEKGEVKVGDSSKHCYVKLFDALSNGLKPNKLYDVKKIKNSARLFFNKKAKAQTKIKEIILKFNKKPNSKVSIKDVVQMEVWDLERKKPTIFRFKKINTKAKIDFMDFEFKVPENTNVTNF